MAKGCWRNPSNLWPAEQDAELALARRRKQRAQAVAEAKQRRRLAALTTKSQPSEGSQSQSQSQPQSQPQPQPSTTVRPADPQLERAARRAATPQKMKGHKTTLGDLLLAQLVA